MTLEEARAPQHCLLEAIAGSRAYGTDTPESDTDIKGVFVQPASSFFGLHRVEQLSNETNDIVFYEIGRFVELLLKCNPGALELLCSPTACVQHQHELMALLKPEMFLSRECFDTFASYALGQIKKARGLNKKIVNPMSEKRPEVVDFCHVLQGQGAVPLTQWLEERGWRQEQCGLVAIPHMRDVYGLYHDATGALGYSGVLSHADSTEVSFSRVPKGEQPVAWMSFNKDGFKKCGKDWREYWSWVEERNEARYATTVAHGKNYDSKNLMHTFRLLDQAEEIATQGTLTVRTRQRDFLMQIRRGEFEYDDLLTMAEIRLESIKAAFENCHLPEKPDRTAAEQALFSVRQHWYAGALS